MDIIGLEKQHTSGVYPKRELAIVRGQGSVVWDDQGRDYIDCTSGHGVAIIGHGNTFVADAVCEQSRRLITLSEVFYNDRRAEALQKLVSIAPRGLDRAFLCNSGTEAVEAGLKFARMATGRTGILATMRGFHGRSMGSLSATWEKKYRSPFEPLVPGFAHVAYNNLDAMSESVDDRTAAVLVEVVQGEGGVRPATPEYLSGLARLCLDRGALLIVDEVQTGFGRTGKMFACEHFGLVPDILLLGKAIAGGVPMGAAMFGPRVSNVAPMSHGSTFGGNPLSCAASVAAIQYMQDNDLPGQSARKGQWFMDRLRRIESPKIREVRGLGLMVGVELREKVQPYLVALMERGILALPAGKTVLRFLPPLVISEEQLERVAQAVEAVLQQSPQGVDDEE